MMEIQLFPPGTKCWFATHPWEKKYPQSSPRKEELKQIQNERGMREPRASLKICLLLQFDTKEEFRSVMREQV